MTKRVTPIDDNTSIEIETFLKGKNMFNKRMKENDRRSELLGRMYWADTDDKVRFTYNGKIREGFIDYIWKWDSFFSRCFMTVNFRDGMEDVENSSYKNFSLNQVEDFKIIKRGA